VGCQLLCTGWCYTTNDKLRRSWIGSTYGWPIIMSGASTSSADVPTTAGVATDDATLELKRNTAQSWVPLNVVVTMAEQVNTVLVGMVAPDWTVVLIALNTTAALAQSAAVCMQCPAVAMRSGAIKVPSWSQWSIEQENSRSC
jgi:hypothetical protein